MITSISISKIEASRENNETIANMKFNINFDDVKVVKDEVEVLFTFTTIYEGAEGSKQIGKLLINGGLQSKESKKDAEEIEDTWRKKKTLPLKFAEDVINMLNFECGSRGTLVAYSIGFVAPLPISRARLQDNPGSTA